VAAVDRGRVITNPARRSRVPVELVLAVAVVAPAFGVLLLGGWIGVGLAPDGVLGAAIACSVAWLAADVQLLRYARGIDDASSRRAFVGIAVVAFAFGCAGFFFAGGRRLRTQAEDAVLYSIVGLLIALVVAGPWSALTAGRRFASVDPTSAVRNLASRARASDRVVVALVVLAVLACYALALWSAQPAGTILDKVSKTV
jgi:hypothetical protein